MQNPTRLLDAIYLTAQVSNAEPLKRGDLFLVALRIPLSVSPKTLNHLMRFLARPKNVEKGLE